MAEYFNIPEAEMNEFLTLQGFSLVKLEGTIELVYGKRVNQDNLPLTLRVYTGIEPNGDSREVGKDAIRVNLFMKNDDGTIVKLGGSKRVHRVVGWKKNLQARLDSWLEYLPKHKCIRCGKPMMPRESKANKSKFLGCSGFPICRFTQPIEE